MPVLELQSGLAPTFAEVEQLDPQLRYERGILEPACNGFTEVHRKPPADCGTPAADAPGDRI
jgi:hypothetical protein